MAPEQLAMRKCIFPVFPVYTYVCMGVQQSGKERDKGALLLHLSKQDKKGTKYQKPKRY